MRRVRGAVGAGRVLVAVVGASVLLAGCGEGGITLPSRTSGSSAPSATESAAPTETVEPTQAPTETSEPTVVPTEPGTPTATDTPQPTATPTETPAPTTAAPTTAAPTTAAPEPTPTPSRTRSASPTPSDTAAKAADDTDSGWPWWLWLLLALVVVGAVIGGVMLARARGRRREWEESLREASSEAAWFARVLVPRLGQEQSVEAVGGGWRASSARIVALEDRLTALVSSAPDEEAAARATRLRDAVRGARAGLDAIGRPGGPPTAGPALSAVVARLETALAPPPPQPR